LNGPKSTFKNRSPAEDFSDQDWEDVLQVNLNAVFTLARDVGRHMLQIRAETGADQEPAHSTAKRSRGKIVNIASLLSYQGGFTVPAYAAAKVVSISQRGSYSYLLPSL